MRPSVAGFRVAVALGTATLGAGAAIMAGAGSPAASGIAAVAGGPAGEGGTAFSGVTLRPPPALAPGDAYHEFHFTRGIYSEGRSWRGRWGGRGDWATDYPKADRQFLVVLQRLVGIDASPDENAVRLSDPELRRYPYLYILEVGDMRLSDEEVEGLRTYLQAGGFLVVDDFWGQRAWATFEREMARVLPGRAIEALPLDHPIFTTYYDITQVRQVPQVGLAERIALGYGNRTWECDGCAPHVLGIFDDERRLMVVINFNTDLGDAWEWAEDPYYPLEFSTYAFEVGVNMIVYAMSH